MHADRAAAYLAYEAVCNETYAPYGGAITGIWNQRHRPAFVIPPPTATCSPRPACPILALSGPGRYLAERQDLLLQPAPADVDHEVFLAEVAELSRLRSVLHSWAGEHHFAGEPANYVVVVAAVEVAANGLRHAGARAGLALTTPSSSNANDTAGRRIRSRPATAGPQLAHAVPGGRGLWLARQLADVVITDSAPGRNSVRLHFPCAVIHRGPE